MLYYLSSIDILYFIGEPSAKKSKLETPEVPNKSNAALDDEVQWEYKLENTDSCNIEGPYSSSHMVQCVEENKFPDGVFARKAGSGAEFYNSKRIDFDLYT